MALSRRALAILLLAPAPAWAESDQERARRALREGRIRPLSEILAIVQPRLGGRVIEVELDEEDGRFVYEFKVMTPRGRIREVEVDAATGEILEIDD
ncbi:PepSY domain-containing protein [Sabulicella rubraurantiaca]|uniref:PepSY domain-containing protein n=1 Tax=Sabulicella rubraurantiaca TaxID=2811429 RepID=UPI001A974479|nr:PepSY domain-containing protein [Sabulicella rubraurantiaca]